MGNAGGGRRTGGWSTAVTGVLGLAAALVVAGCTSTPPSADEMVTVTSTVGAAVDPAGSDPLVTPPATGPVVVPPLNEPIVESTAPTQGTDIQVEPTSSVAPTSATTTTTTTKTTPPKPKPKPATVMTQPGDGAKGVDPLGRVRVLAAGGVLTRVALHTPDGRLLRGGSINTARTAWSIVPELGYGRTYRLEITARAKDGTVTDTVSTFTTVVPKSKVTATSFPRNGMTVGVGQPISITFSRPIRGAAAKKFVEKQITVKTAPRQRGAFRWFSDTELHWRPEKFWHTATKVSVDADIYGKNLGGGLYGQADLVFGFATRRVALIATVDDRTHQMTITRNGAKVKTIPVSLGQDKYPTYNGTHIVAEKYTSKIMDSRTWGLTGTGAYRTNVKWATRISSSGEFVHARPVVGVRPGQFQRVARLRERLRPRTPSGSTTRSPTAIR